MTTNGSSPSAERPAPELLAPAGNWDCARAAVENGADAIYFGLQVGFNARARAANFAIETLPQLMSMLHLRGVKGYVTLNTLVFTDELRASKKMYDTSRPAESTPSWCKTSALRDSFGKFAPILRSTPAPK